MRWARAGAPADRDEEAEEIFRRLSERPAELLRFATAGSVDDGKSTLIGRLLYDSKQVLADQLEHVEQTSRRMGHDFLDLSLLTDGLRAEREQGITIDVAYRYFATAQRRFIIADTPGHEQYTRNMVTGASTADLVIVLIDARKGVVAQSRRHAFIASLLQIPHLVVCVNKMDMLGYDEEVFDSIVAEFERFAARLDIQDVTFIPISALKGDNVVERSEAMPWYQGPPLLYHLEHVHIASDRNLIDVRFPVQWVIRPRSAPSGRLPRLRRPGRRRDPTRGRRGGGAAGRPAHHDRGDRHLRRAGARGVPADVRGAAPRRRGRRRPRQHDRAPPQPADRRQQLREPALLDVRAPAGPQRRYLVKHTTRTAAVGGAGGALPDRGGHDAPRRARRDARAQRPRARACGAGSPLVFDSYRRNRATGSLIVIDEATNETVAAGVILDTEVESEARRTASRKTERSPNVRWERETITRDERWAALGLTGATVWLTGLPAAGKSTIGRAIEERLVRAGRPAYLLDGDNLRHGLNGDLGFDECARAENVRRTAHVARLLAECGAVALVSLVSPYAADRELAATLHAKEELPFLEVFVGTPLAQCEQRDPKGLYARARSGELDGLTGVGAPYEAPTAPDVVVGAPGEAIEAAVDRVLEALAARGVLGSAQ